MNRIDQLFREKQKQILSIYITAGFPELDDTVNIIKELEESGADMVEIGMPFSDPLADGPVIQNSSQVALRNGMNIPLLFRQLKEIRNSVSIPLVLMGYLNPVLQFGFPDFIKKCKETGIDGLIIPDLPLKIFEKEYRKMIEEAKLKFVMLITPQTSEERILQIAEASGQGGFLYMVADSSTTGARQGIKEVQLDYFKRINDMKIEIPRLIGFGISDHHTFNRACEYANGAIIGSAFIYALGRIDERSVEEKSSDFVKSILQK